MTYDPILESYSMEMLMLGGITVILVLAIAIKLVYRFFKEITA